MLKITLDLGEDDWVRRIEFCQIMTTRLIAQTHIIEHNIKKQIIEHILGDTTNGPPFVNGHLYGERYENVTSIRNVTHRNRTSWRWKIKGKEDVQ